MIVSLIPVSSFGQAANLPGGVKGVVVDSTGNVFFSGLGFSVLRWEASTGILTSVTGNGTPGYNGDHGPATSAQLQNVIGVALDGADNLYIADAGNAVIRKVSNGMITTVKFLGYSTLYADGAFHASGAAAVDSAGNLYVADPDYQLVHKVSNGVVTIVLGTGTPGFSGDDGPRNRCSMALKNRPRRVENSAARPQRNLILSLLRTNG